MTKKTSEKFSNSFFKASIIVVLFVMSLVVVPSGDTSVVHASLQDDLNAVNAQLDATNQSVAAKKDEIKTLGDEINMLNEQINQTQLQIQSTEYKIQLLGEKITQTEKDLTIQKDTLNEYLRVIYEESNTSPLELIASSNSFSDFVDKSEYLQTMQMKIQDTVEKVKQMKADLENNKKETEKMKDQLISQKSDLAGKRAGKDTLLSMAQTNAALLQQDANSLIAKRGTLYCQIYGGCGDPNGNLIVVNDNNPPYTYYSQKDPAWANFEYSPGWYMWSDGCLITSYAMVHTMLGSPINPQQEAIKDGPYSGGNMGHSGDERAVGNPPDWSQVNAALDAGKPVIANYSGMHFIVIIKHSGDTYFVNDPYFEIGHKYSSKSINKVLIY
ncbi:MAG: hypothetical protein Q7S53_02595 [bacterium]|nr:hypothetical protein [bacterium]